ncbi:hypothetical protein GCM10023219_04260 [Stakelama sediminis]|uniref:Uncharacterized protein n=1 Tax=Stakelama sediminis TaxID=463200 RepID=A0A840YU93_9SPHN|nr:hypothetical protein [Stakelama sediminis]MBB5717140.1 hypothetical protein [Stakelama sediminis]
MQYSWLVPVLIVAVVMASKAFSTWVRVKHGYDPNDCRSGRNSRGSLESERKVELLSAENERLTGQVHRLEERIAVLERIATDPAERTAREIEALREPRTYRESYHG